MNKAKEKFNSQIRRHNRVRAKVFGVGKRPRLCVSKSLKGVYLQIIDDAKGTTIASQGDKGIKGNKTERARRAGMLIAEKCKNIGIESAVFDRGACLFHGRIKAVAEGAREKGLKF